ncbi:hypothetical protein SLEP1_g17169 [Rubroshorea leprosula]|uniref:Uncharacterized protein n=1 Tax=Rubroshorea leprosula TaxID=152421 RepID=A0AAV5J2H0_9ROSI|nr:hypothetical protein SLEP1_g17169 [Rubroshorea leprosula]
MGCHLGQQVATGPRHVECGSTLFSGYTDGVVRVWGIGHY